MTNLDIIKTYQDQLWDDKDINAVDKYFAENAMVHSPLESVQGTEKMKAIIEQWTVAFPDLKVHWDDFICDDTKVVSRWHAEGTQSGEFLGRPASNKKVDYSGVTIYQLEQGKVIHYWALVDMQRLLQQLS